MNDMRRSDRNEKILVFEKSTADVKGGKYSLVH